MSYTRTKPRYSVSRVESAKQRALTGEAFEVHSVSRRLQMDWTSDDEADLCSLIQQWDRRTGHAGLNALIDHYQFSCGTQYENSGMKRMIEHGRIVDSHMGEKCMEKIVVITMADGAIKYDTRQYPLTDTDMFPEAI